MTEPAAQPADTGRGEGEDPSVTPEEFMMLPIRMKSGAASSGNELAAWAIFWGTIPAGMPAKCTKAKAARPIEAKSGTPISRLANQAARI